MKNLKQEFTKTFGTFGKIKCAFINFTPFNNIDEDGDSHVDDDVLAQLPKDSFEANLKLGYTQAELNAFIDKIDFNFLDGEELSDVNLEDLPLIFEFKCWFTDGSYTAFSKENRFDSWGVEETILIFRTIKIPTIPTELI